MPEPVTNRINAGCYVFRRSIIDTIPFGEIARRATDISPTACQRRPGTWFCRYGVLAGRWLSTGDRLRLPRSCLGQGSLASAAWRPGRATHPPGSRLDAAATVRGGSAVGTDVTVRRGAVVDGSVVDDGAVIEADAVVRDSFIGAGARIGTRTVIDGAVVGDRAQIGADCEVASGTRVWVDAVLGDLSIRTSSDQA